MATLPTFSDIIDLHWFVEPLRSSDNPGNFLDRFPDELYNKSVDTHLVRFMYALLGPSGIGWYKQNVLGARLVLEDAGLQLFDLESFYGNPFGFGRLISELYDEDPTGLLPRDQWAAIKAKDESYRTRAIAFFNAVRMGTSPEGMRLASTSALNHDVDIVENYKYLFDSHSDDPLGLTYKGKTRSTEEFIVVPKRETSRTEVQTISFEAPFDSGLFVLAFNGQETTNYKFSPSTHTVANQTVGGTFTLSVASAGGWPSSGTLYKNGTPITYTGRTEVTFTGCTGFTGTIYANTPILSQPVHYTSIPWDCTSFQVQAALQALPNITNNAVTVTGGPPPNDIVVTFTGILSNQDVAELVVASGLMDSTASNAIRDVTITTTAGGVDSTDEVVVIPPADQHALQTALDLLRPVGTIPTVDLGSGNRTRQDWQSALATSEYTEVLRYVTGSTSVPWPALDSVHWIEESIEVEAPRVHQDLQHHYVGFHNIPTVAAYSGDALNDAEYDTDGSVVSNYNSVHVGPFPTMKGVIAFFDSQVDPHLVYSADRAPADYAEPLTVTTKDDTTGFQFINGIYPTDYSNLPAVPQIKYKDDQFWSSREAISGADYLEIDLGKTQAVNYVAFEVIQKPIVIEISYDILDQPPSRHFEIVTPSDRSDFPNALRFDPSNVNPWLTLEFNFTDVLTMIPFTRYIRIGIQRRIDDSTIQSGFLFDPATSVQSPWSVEVRNLRIGRRVS